MIFRIGDPEKHLLDEVRLASNRLDIEAYVVGGFVRDRLLGRASSDIDIVCVGNGIQLAQEVAGALWPVPRVVVYKRFGTAMLKHQSLEIEFVGARKESYRSDSRKPNVEPGTLEDDQNRRDFTINALAVSLNDHNFGEILDPFNGFKDLENKIIRTPLEPGKTFSDDPLRMVRAIRFATQLGFEIEEETLRSISRYRNRIHIVSQERITTELNKIILSDMPSIGFTLLFDTGLLELIFPELCALQGVDIQRGIGHKDNFYHTLEVLDNISGCTDNLWLRWAAILHDIAKPNTKRFHPQSGWTFHGHEALGANMVPDIFKRLRLPLDHKMKYVQKLVRLHLRPISLVKEEITDSAIRRLIYEAGDDLEDLMTLCEADITSKNPNRVAKYLQNYQTVRRRLSEVEDKDKLRNWQPPITGEEIMETFGIAPSKIVGTIKNKIRESILDGEIPNTYEAAHALMLEMGQKLGLELVEEQLNTNDKTNNQ